MHRLRFLTWLLFLLFWGCSFLGSMLCWSGLTFRFFVIVLFICRIVYHLIKSVLRIYKSSLNIHLLGLASLAFSFHLFLGFGLGCGLRLGWIFGFLLFFWGRRGRRFGHDLLDLLVDFLDLILDIVGGDGQRFIFGDILLFFVGIDGPFPGLVDGVVSFLSFLGRDMLVFFILNIMKCTSEFNFSTLVLREASRF